MSAADAGIGPRVECDEAPRVRLPVVSDAPQRRRPRTISNRRASKRALERGAMEYPVEEHALYERPVTRADCLAGGSNAARPCPWASCRHHLAAEVSERTGNAKVTWPGVDVADMAETCDLDVADRGGVTLDEAGAVMNLTRERIRQLELIAFARIREVARIDVIAADTFDVAATTGEHAASDDGSGERTDADAVHGLTEFGGGEAMTVGGWR